MLPRPRVKDTRAALGAHFTEERFVHPAALFAPDAAELAAWLSSNEADEGQDGGGLLDAGDGDPTEHDEGVFREAAE